MIGTCWTMLKDIKTLIIIKVADDLEKLYSTNCQIWKSIFEFTYVTFYIQVAPFRFFVANFHGVVILGLPYLDSHVRLRGN